MAKWLSFALAGLMSCAVVVADEPTRGRYLPIDPKKKTMTREEISEHVGANLAQAIDKSEDTFPASPYPPDWYGSQSVSLLVLKPNSIVIFDRPFSPAERILVPAGTITRVLEVTNVTDRNAPAPLQLGEPREDRDEYPGGYLWRENYRVSVARLDKDKDKDEPDFSFECQVELPDLVEFLKTPVETLVKGHKKFRSAWCTAGSKISVFPSNFKIVR